MTEITVRAADPAEPGATAMLHASHALMQSLYPSEANHYLSVDALRQPDIRFFVAAAKDKTVGCAALAHRGDYGEVKSMYVDPSVRGAGVGAMLLDRLTREARAQNLPRLRLETGTGLDAAHRLYARDGFTPCAAFGDYAPDAPFSVYMERTT